MSIHVSRKDHSDRLPTLIIGGTALACAAAAAITWMVESRQQAHKNNDCAARPAAARSLSAPAAPRPLMPRP